MYQMNEEESQFFKGKEGLRTQKCLYKQPTTFLPASGGSRG